VPLEDNLRDRSPAEKRDEREELGFLRQPAVRWLSPGLLARSGVEVLVSGTFGKFADKREIQREPQLGMDYSAAAGDVWVDYLSDTGDGWEATYTMAWLLAQESLDFDGQALPRGRILLLGGDQVYPTAEPVAYEDRFIGPFAAAWPKSGAVDKPELYAIPGNHDWYDGLASFLRVFCAREGRIGEWRTRQRRSYFALKLPNDWWIWALGLVALFAAGAALGATVFGCFLLAVHRVRGSKSWETANQIFTAQSIPDYKNLVRMRFAADGSLTLYPLGCDRVGRAWDYTPEQAPGPKFSPRGAAPAAHAIDVPLGFDRTGRRSG